MGAHCGPGIVEGTAKGAMASGSLLFPRATTAFRWKIVEAPPGDGASPRPAVHSFLSMARTSARTG